MSDIVDEPAPPPAAESRAEAIAALIRNSLANTAVSQSAHAWQALETRLPEIVAAIIKEA
ncbi:MAG TPA: hypothetical protein VKQ70_03155 [Caulobacteraceae bacterium]|jgi:hypothetical protein|nr:hypothetical protein [Caulobacteraceae bacterium]